MENPRNAQTITVIACYVAVLSLTALGFYLVMDDELDYRPLSESLLEKMDCQSLKDVMKNTNISTMQKELVQKYMLAECL